MVVLNECTGMNLLLGPQRTFKKTSLTPHKRCLNCPKALQTAHFRTSDAKLLGLLSFTAEKLGVRAIHRLGESF